MQQAIQEELEDTLIKYQDARECAGVGEDETRLVRVRDQGGSRWTMGATRVSTPNEGLMDHQRILLRAMDARKLAREERDASDRRRTNGRTFVSRFKRFVGLN